jgi:hypothetical protein
VCSICWRNSGGMRLAWTRAFPETVNSTVDWLLAHHETPDDQMPGLHFGEAGVAIAIAESIASGLISRGRWTEPYFQQVFSSKPDWPDLTHGAAGQGLAALCCGQLLDEEWIARTSDAYAEFLRSVQQEDGSWMLPPGVQEMENKAFTGCAHGAAGIVHFPCLSCYDPRRHSVPRCSRAGCAVAVG